MAAVPIISVMAFVDWRAQMHNAGMADTFDVNEQASRTLSSISRVLTRALLMIDKTARYKVNLRLYHGWTKGFQSTANRNAISQVLAGVDFSSLSTSSSVVINQDVGFGDVLLSALPSRMVAGRFHLPGTLRGEDDERRLREKMVDTALASDLLTAARTDPQDWAIVLAEDDDIVPPLFVAESWKAGGAGKVFLLRKRDTGKQNLLKLDGILLRDVWR